MADPSQDLMKLVAGGAGKTGAPPPQAGPGGAPVSAPMTTPQPNEGLQQAAMVDITMALDLLEKSLQAFGSETQQGKVLLGALSRLSQEFGEKRQKAKELVPAELRQLMASQQPSPEMMAMAGGGAPGGAPAPMPA